MLVAVAGHRQHYRVRHGRQGGGPFRTCRGRSHGFRLPNGHTLVTAEGTKYIELDKNWKPIKETDAGGHPPSASNDGKCFFARVAEVC